jgi:hypothetical protein
MTAARQNPLGHAKRSNFQLIVIANPRLHEVSQLAQIR